LANQKRNLNLLLGRDVNTDFVVDTSLVYADGLMLDVLLVHAGENNVNVLQQEALVRNSEFEIKTTNSNVCN